MPSSSATMDVLFEKANLLGNRPLRKLFYFLRKLKLGVGIAFPFE